MRTIQLVADEVVYFSPLDEAAFFDWLDSIAGVVQYEGRGSQLFIEVNAALSADDLRELLALFHRYGVAMRQLAVFDYPRFRRWFRRKHAFWHLSVFGSTNTNRQ